MVTDKKLKRVQRKIAEVQGYTEVDGCEVLRKKHWHLPAPIKHPTSDLCFTHGLPDWPTDRNASYELPVDVKGKWQRVAGDYEVAFFEALEYYGWHPARLLSAYQECLIWLAYRGWRWVECKEFRCVDGKEQVFDQMTWPDCPTCNGDGGEWVKA